MRCGRSSRSSSPVGSSPSCPRCAIVRRAAHRLRSKPPTFSSSTLGSSSDTARRASKGRPTTPSIGTRSSVTSPSCKRASGRSYRDISSAINQLGWREAVFSTPAENRQQPHAARWHPARQARHSTHSISKQVQGWALINMKNSRPLPLGLGFKCRTTYLYVHRSYKEVCL